MSRHLLDCLRDLDRALRERGAAPDHAQRRPGRGGAADREAGGAGGDPPSSEDFSAPRAARARRGSRPPAATAGIALRAFPGVTAVEPGAVLPRGGGDHYRVFTPYWRAWREQPRRQVAAGAAVTGDPPPSAVRVGRIPTLRRALRRAPSPAPRIQQGGETAAAGGGAVVGLGGVDAYEDRARRPRRGTGRRDWVAVPALRLPLGGRADPARAAAGGGPGAEAFVRQLVWRDFHHQVLAARPDAAHADYRPHEDHWHRDQRGARRLEGGADRDPGRGRRDAPARAPRAGCTTGRGWRREVPRPEARPRLAGGASALPLAARRR